MMRREPERLSELLDAGLEYLVQGGSIEMFLRRHPREAVQLRPLLMLAEQVRGVLAVQPQPECVNRSRAMLLAYTFVCQPKRKDWSPPLLSVLPTLRAGYRAALAVGILSIVLSLGSAVASAHALPDTPLYPLKIGAEQIRLVLAQDEGARLSIQIDEAVERTEEVAALITRGRPISGHTLADLRRQTRTALDGVAASGSPEAAQRLMDLTSRQAQVLEPLLGAALVPQQRELAQTLGHAIRGYAWAKLISDAASARQGGSPIGFAPSDDRSASLSPELEPWLARPQDAGGRNGSAGRGLHEGQQTNGNEAMSQPKQNPEPSRDTPPTESGGGRAGTTGSQPGPGRSHER